MEEDTAVASTVALQDTTAAAIDIDDATKILEKKYKIVPIGNDGKFKIVEDENKEVHDHDDTKSSKNIFIGLIAGVALLIFVGVGFGIAWGKRTRTNGLDLQNEVKVVIPWSPTNATPQMQTQHMLSKLNGTGNLNGESTVDGDDVNIGGNQHGEEEDGVGISALPRLPSTSSMVEYDDVFDQHDDACVETPDFNEPPSTEMVSNQTRSHIGVRNFGVRDFDLTPSPTNSPGRNNNETNSDGNNEIVFTEAAFNTPSPPLGKDAVFHLSNFGMDD